MVHEQPQIAAREYATVSGVSTSRAQVRLLTISVCLSLVYVEEELMLIEGGRRSGTARKGKLTSRCRMWQALSAVSDCASEFDSMLVLAP